MLFDNKQMQVMTSGLDALAQQQKMILHNLANYETPNYKSKNVVFEGVLRDARGRYSVKSKVVEENNTTVRPDGNNVDADVENMSLYENYVQSLYVYSKISAQISNYRNVLKSAPR